MTSRSATYEDSRAPRGSAAVPMLGARLVEDGAHFGAYVTTSEACAVRIYDSSGKATATHPMLNVGGGYFAAHVLGVLAGTLYRFVVGERELTDPYARYLPQGVHGPAMLTKREYAFRHGNVSLPLAQQVIYELHVGTFTKEGTYEAARHYLGYLASLGVRTLELMPIAAFDGTRGWGYDGVAFYAPFAPYGTPDDLRRFVDEAHAWGLSVVLDVVYNHFGPSGNYLSAYCPDYDAKEGNNAWGGAPNFSFEPMRRYVVDNAVYWLTEFRFDGLRLDAVHAIQDESPRHVLSELRDAVAALNERTLLIAEDDRNDPDCLTDLGFSAVWADDFHHQVRVTLTGERDGYFSAYSPGVRGIAEAIGRGWLYEGQTYPLTGKPRGKPAQKLPVESLVYCIQNHDQVGNRALGERLSKDISIDAYCAASMLLLFLPMTPLLFMGQEWAASTPFLYFTDHARDLAEAITNGRRNEFRSFAAFADPKTRDAIPDPQAEETFASSRLQWREREEGEHARVLDLYRELLHLRRSDPVLQHASRESMRAEAVDNVLVVRRELDADVRILCVNFGTKPVSLAELNLEASGVRGLLPALSSIRSSDHETLPAQTAVILAGRVARTDSPTMRDAPRSTRAAQAT